MHQVRRGRFTVTRAEDVWIWDDTGRRYLDGTAALWYCNAGHGRHEIIDAITRQMKQLDAYQIFGDFANEPALRLADEVAARAPMDDAKVFFTSGGGDSIDTAAAPNEKYFSKIFPESWIAMIELGQVFPGDAPGSGAGERAVRIAQIPFRMRLLKPGTPAGVVRYQIKKNAPSAQMRSVG